MSWSKVYKGNNDFKPLRLLSNVFNGPNTLAEKVFHSSNNSSSGEFSPNTSDSETSVGGTTTMALEDLKKQAFEQGKQAGIKEAEARFGDTSNALADLLSEVSGLRESIINNSSQDMLRLVMAISRQIIHKETSLDDDIILETLSKALRAAIKTDEYHIKINPDDLATVNDKKPLFLTSISGLKNITVEPDPSVAKGGCLVESSLGQVDATIESQLEKLYNHLQKSMENE